MHIYVHHYKDTRNELISYLRRSESHAGGCLDVEIHTKCTLRDASGPEREVNWMERVSIVSSLLFRGATSSFVRAMFISKAISNETKKKSVCIWRTFDGDADLVGKVLYRGRRGLFGIGNVFAKHQK